MNQITIKGSDMTGFISELQAKVTQHEGVNLDVNRFQMVKDADGDVWLRGEVVQPTYHAYINKNLTLGDEEMDENGVPSALTPIDKDAVAGDALESYQVSATALRSVLRGVGTETGVFQFTDSGVDVKVGDAHYSLSAKKMKSEICLPEYVNTKSEAVNGKYFPIGYFKENALTGMLLSAIQLSKVSSHSANIKGQAVHLVFELGNAGQLIQVEAVSSTAGLRLSEKNNFQFLRDIETEYGGTLHYAIALPAAECLYKMLHDEGKKAYVAYDEYDKNIIVWCGSYIINIAVEDVKECLIPGVGDMENGVAVSAKVLANLVSKVQTTGNKTVSICIHTDGLVDVNAPNGKYTNSFRGMTIGALKTDTVLTLPVSTLIAVLRGFSADATINIMLDDKQSYIVLRSQGGDVEGAISKI